MTIQREVVLGGILHDIGKFVMRGQNSNINHSVSGFDFLKSKGFDNVAVLECVSCHHKKFMGQVKEHSIANIVYVADNIASAIDRRDDIGEEEQKQSKWKKDAVLENIFNTINYSKDSKALNSFYTLDVLREDASIIENFTDDNNKTNSTGVYNSAFGLFDSAFSRIDFENDSIESILNVLEVTTSFVPSSTDNTQKIDISLYNHSKITGMIASCIYNYFKENKISDFKTKCMSDDIYNKDMFILASYDISGIQSFIYNSAEKNALKMLRGRSFYLELMTEHVIDEILESMELTRVNLLYSGGGHFYLLLPNIDKYKNLLDDATIKINDFLMNEFNGVLSISHGYSICTADDLRNSKEKVKTKNLLGDVFSKTSQNISKKKLSKYSKEQLNTIFFNESSKEESRECMVCRTTKNLVENIDKSGQFICDVCDSSIRLGSEIPKLTNKLLVVTEDKNNSLFNLPSLSNKNKLKYISICTVEEAKDLLEDSGFCRIYSINKYLSGNKFANNLWVGNYAYKNDFKEFSESSIGINRIGVLRMDIDNLGTTISKGFETKGDYPYQYVSLSRSSMLSYNLSLFFKNEINKIAKNGRSFTLMETYLLENDRNISIVYSGGDDLFVVGAWNEVLEFAVDVNNAFKKFTNGKVTLSGGFAMFKHNFPVYQMAKITGKLEELAKSRVDENGIKVKNAIALFGENEDTQMVYDWSKFENDICKDKLKFLIDNLQDEEGRDETKINVGMSMIYKLMSLLINTDKNSINIARMAYTLSRLEPKEDSKKETFNLFKEKIYEYCKNKEDREQLVVAIYLYVYLNRKD
ncbi:MAG: type III-A CRISPR-associated protein Cas10/Csm1 [Lachnospirales bacterium]